MHNLDSSIHRRHHLPTVILRAALVQVLAATNGFSWCYCMAPHDEDTKAPTVGNLFCNSFFLFSISFYPPAVSIFLLVYQIAKTHFTWHNILFLHIILCFSHVIETNLLLLFSSRIALQLKFFAKSL